MANISNGNTAPAHGVNDTRYDDYQKELTKFAEAAGAGEDAQAKAFYLTCDYAYQQVLDLEKNKHGKNLDDAWRNARLYWEARNKKTVFGTKKGTERKLASNFRSMIKLGNCTKWGVGQPIGNVSKLLTIRQNLQAKKENTGKLKDAGNLLISYARQQLKDDVLFDDKKLKELCFLPLPGKATVEDVLQRIHDTAKSLYEGKHDAGQAETVEVEKIIDNAAALIGRIVEAKNNGTEVDGVETS